MHAPAPSTWIKGIAIAVGLTGVAFVAASPVVADISKRCSACMKEIALSSQVGDRCPHCGVTWSAEKWTQEESPQGWPGSGFGRVGKGGNGQEKIDPRVEARSRNRQLARQARAEGRALSAAERAECRARYFSAARERRQSRARSR